MGGKIYDVVCMSIHTTCGMSAHLYHIVCLSMLEDRYGSEGAHRGRGRGEAHSSRERKTGAIRLLSRSSHVCWSRSVTPYKEWDGQLYMYTVLPFGWSGACLAFTRLMSVVWQPLRARGMRLVYMLDDCGSVASTLLEAQRSMRLQALLMSALGFVTREKKCQLEALPQLTFLGAVITSATMRCTIPEKKLTKVQEFVENVAAQRKPIDMQLLQHLTGVLMAWKPMVTLASLYLRRLYALAAVADAEKQPQPLSCEHLEDLMR